MRIKFWGVRGSIAAPGPETVIYGGNTSCVEVTTSSNKTVIIDAGTGIRVLGDHLLKAGKHRDLYVLLTHIHWDHIIGFPFFSPLFMENVHIKLDGTKRGMEGLQRVLSSNYIDGFWPIRFEDLRAKLENLHNLPKQPLEIDDLSITAHELHHPQGGMGFKFIEHGRTFVFLTDNELTFEGWQGRNFPDFVNFCRAADVLVHDCQYLPEEMQIKKGWGHSDTNTVAKLASEAGVKELILFHHDPWRSDKELVHLVERCRESLNFFNPGIKVSAAQEGFEFLV